MSDFRWGLGHLSLDFVATLGARRTVPVERLGAPEDLERWLTTAGLLEGTGHSAIPTDIQLADARQLREAIYRVLTAGRLGDAPSRDDVDLINRNARGAIAALQIGPGLSVVRLATDPVAVAITELARASVELLTGAELPRVRQCDGCSLLFLDRSRPGQRRWCSMGSCGNRSKTARYRAKRDGVAEDVIQGSTEQPS
ncbi:MAG TPA: ABATE domain-containing protein [Streptosporangiaceae bacterium]|nr:ABATE domain-containing protein [Streptosporangiaceae bacterium]